MIEIRWNPSDRELRRWGVLTACVTAAAGSLLQWVPWGPFAAAHALAPWVWRQAERFETGADYRIPYTLSKDYWLWQRRLKELPPASAVVLGDSVVWGEYVLPDGTLFGEGIKTRLKEHLMEECNLHTIVRLPNGVFNQIGRASCRERV